MLFNENITIHDLEKRLGDDIRALRITYNLTRDELSAKANVGVGAIKNLETGNGSTLKTLIGVMRGLGKTEWLNTIAPVASIDPRKMVRAHTQAARRVRASKPRNPNV